VLFGASIFSVFGLGPAQQRVTGGGGDHDRGAWSRVFGASFFSRELDSTGAFLDKNTFFFCSGFFGFFLN